MTNNNIAGNTIPFNTLGLPEKLVKASERLGFENATEIQNLSIPPLLQGKDVTGIAQTGTGKTAAFGFPLLAKIMESPNIHSNDKKPVLGLILCPTRELAVQTANAIGTYAAAAHLHNFDITAIYGGANFTGQLRALKDGVDVVVATPGRLIDMLDRRAVDLSQVSVAILDEADEMLKMGFTEDVDKILLATGAHDNDGNPIRQTALFSATMPASIKKIADKHQNNSVQIQAQKVSTTNANIEQSYAIVPFPKKTEATRRLILASHAKAVIVFVKTRSTAGKVSEDLTAIGIPSVVISGDVAQKERERIVEGMRKGKIRVMIATDVAARGLDIEAIELVINYDPPMENEAYVHRIGRTGRAGRQGEAVMFISPREKGKLMAIQKLIGQELVEREIPTMQEVAAKQAKGFLGRAFDRRDQGHLEKYMKPVVKALQNFEHEGELIEYVSAIVALAVHDVDPEGDSDSNTKFGDTFEERGAKRSRSSRNGRGNREGNRGDRGDRSGGRDGGRDGRREGGRDGGRDGNRGKSRDSSNRRDSFKGSRDKSRGDKSNGREFTPKRKKHKR